MKILYFYPENPLLLNQGNNARALALLKYFKDRNISVDFVGEKSKDLNEESLAELKKESLINEGFLLTRLNRRKNQLKYFFLFSLPRKIKGKMKDFNRTKFGQEDEFSKICSQKDYDYIIVSYACWAPLIDKLDRNKAKLIIDTHDFLTSQFQGTKRFDMGKYFEKEINLLKKFDKVWVISNEEKYLFSQFISDKVDLITHSLPNNANPSKSHKTVDVLYVASDNAHNIKSANWFFETVYPHLPSNIKITVVGRVNHHFPDFENVQKLLFVDDLHELYNSTKITICPMLSGTGVKIKVIESLSYGIPVVCNERGVDGLSNKTKNGCLVANDPKLFAENMMSLLHDNQLYDKIGMEAESFFSENFDVKKTYSTLDSQFRR